MDKSLKVNLEKSKLDIEFNISDELDLITCIPTDDKNHNNLAINTLFEIKSYLNTFGTQDCKTVAEFIYKFTLFDEEDFECFKSRLIYEFFQTPFETNVLSKNIFDIYLDSILLLIKKVLSQNLDDPHFSGIIALRRLQQYLYVTEKNIDKYFFLEECGFTKTEISELVRRNKLEFDRWHGEQPVDWL